MRLRNAWVGLLGMAMATALVACGGSSETSNKSGDASAPSATPAGQRVDTATAGTVKGVVTLDGTAPKNEGIKMNADPVCVRENKTPQFQTLEKAFFNYDPTRVDVKGLPAVSSAYRFAGPVVHAPEDPRSDGTPRNYFGNR